MRTFPLRAGTGWIAVLLLLPGLSGQAADNTRVLKIEGVSFTLPPSWEWQSLAAPNIAVKAPVKVGTRDDEVVAELFWMERRFVNDRLQELEGDARRNPVDHKEFKIEDNQSFAGNKDVAIITYVKERGEDPVRLYQRRHCLFRRYGHLYEWREEWPKDASQASGLLASVRNALKFGKPESPAVTEAQRDYVNQRTKFRLPDDWNWQETEGTKGKKGTVVEVNAEGDKTVGLFVAVTDMMFKEGRGRIAVGLNAIKSGGTVAQIVEFNKQKFTDNVREPKDFTIEDKIPFRGEKATRVSFTGRRKDSEDMTRYMHRMLFFKHKGHIFLWEEISPTGREQQALKLFEEARKGLSTY